MTETTSDGVLQIIYKEVSDTSDSLVSIHKMCGCWCPECQPDEWEDEE